MIRNLIYLIEKRIRLLKAQIKNERMKCDQIIINSSMIKNNIEGMDKNKNNLIIQLKNVRSNNLSYCDLFILYIKMQIFFLREAWRKLREKRYLVKKDKEHISDLLKQKISNTENYGFDVEVERIENDIKEVVGKRKIVVFNKKTRVKKTYYAGEGIAYDWYIKCSNDIDKGYFDKRKKYA